MDVETESAGGVTAAAHASAPLPAAEAVRLIAALRARLLTGHSATRVLESWCLERGWARDLRLTAMRVAGVETAPSRAQRDRLAVAADEPIRYRRVHLTLAGHVLSRADNWYVPGRLTPAMNHALETTQIPFGRVVAPLMPRRENLRVVPLWTPGSGQVPAPDDVLLSIDLLAIDAVLRVDDRPLCAVAETYTGGILRAGEG